MASGIDLHRDRRSAATQAITLASGEDRSRAFRRARRHSRLVRVLRIGLPVLAIAMFATYGISVRLSFKDSRGGEFTGSVPTISGENLTMANPEYQGFNKDGSRYVIRSKTASQDLKQTGPILLDDIEARLLQTDNALTVLKGRQGTFQIKTGVLEIFDGIDVVSESGMKARLASATILTKESRVVSDKPVLVEMPTGQVHGNKLEILQKTREIKFSGGVSTRLVNTPKPGAATKPAPSDTKAGQRLFTASNAPVEVWSNRLDVDDLRKTALFTGQVSATQGDTRLEAPELEVHYTGQATPGATPAAASGSSPVPEAGNPPPAAAAQGRLKQIYARGDVTITRPTDVVRSRVAEFDAEAETAALTGGVFITSLPDRQVTGERADLDLKGETTRLSGNVVITSGADRRATADVADIDQRNDTALLTGEAVVVTQGLNVLRGKRLWIDRRAGLSDMTTPGGRIAARLHRAEAKTPAKAETSQAAAPAGGLSFKTDPTAPIDIDADVLNIDDTAKTATFRGDVHAVQADFTIRTPELVASYTGQGGLTADALPSPAEKKPAAGGESKAEASTQLQTIRANKKVVITSKGDQSATGDWAIFDVKANTVTVGGNVILTQVRNVIRGQKLIIDMTTGHARVETLTPQASVDAIAAQIQGGAAAAPSAQTPAAIAAGACGGRMCGVFFPKDLKEQSAKQKAAPAASPGQVEPKKPSAVTAPAKPSASSWSGSLQNTN